MNRNVEALRVQIAQLRSELEAVQSLTEQLDVRAGRGRPYGNLLLGVCAAVAVLSLVASAPAGKPAPLTVMAPFRVVDDANKTIFHVQDDGSQLHSNSTWVPWDKDGTLKKAEDGTDIRVAPVFSGRGAYVLDSSGSVQAMMTAAPFGGGLVRAMEKNDSGTSVSIGAVPGEPQLVIRHNNRKLVQLGKAKSGENFVGIFNNAEKNVAALTSIQATGAVAVFNAAGKSIAFLQESEAFPGGGAFAVADPSGTVVFYANASAEGGNACVMRKLKKFCIGPSMSKAAN